MNQNSIIAFALLLGFIVFITMRGELQQYLAVVGLSNAALPGATPTASSPASSPFGNLSLPGIGGQFLSQGSSPVAGSYTGPAISTTPIAPPSIA